MKYRERTLEELEAKRSHLASRTALVGLDGFVDKIVTPVAQRSGPGEDFEPIPSIKDFGQRILNASDKSTNIELFPRQTKLGGNAPLMASGLLACGLKTRFLGALGKPEIHPVFQDFARRSEAISIGNPGFTTALEFTDGKIMLNETTAFETISYEQILADIGEGLFQDLISRMDLIALVNWTMIPGMTEILAALLEKLFPILPPRDQRFFFFDLADPEKRTEGDLVSALKTISRFPAWGSVTLGLNLKEAQQVSRALNLNPEIEPEEGSLKKAATDLRREMQIQAVVIHPRRAAVCATRADTWFTPGPFEEKPAITTGAGDHFNAGFTAGQLMGLSPPACLTLGATASGLYVRTGRSPGLNEIDRFLRNWK